MFDKGKDATVVHVILSMSPSPEHSLKFLKMFNIVFNGSIFDVMWSHI